MQIIERIAQLLLIYSSEQIEQTGTAIKDISKSNGKFRDSKIIDQINKAMNYYLFLLKIPLFMLLLKK